MQKITIAVLISVFTLVVSSGGCKDDRPEEPNKTVGEVVIAVHSAILKQRARFDSIPGKTGILAEERLYSVFAEELIIRDYFQDRRGGFFLDVGCAWPVTGSNTYYLEKHLGWTGIGIDALDDFAAEWAEVRPMSKFFNYLITDKSGGEGTFFKSEGLGISSTSRRHARGKRFGVEVEPEEIKVPMITLTDLLEREGVIKVDVVSMDIEGHEAKALAGFDIERFAPDLLVIEGKSRKVQKYMAARGYIRIERYARYDAVNRYFERRQTAAPRE